MRLAIVGAGPVGLLAAIYAAKRGHQVDVYELRPDPRRPSSSGLTQSINLAMSERGLKALREACHDKLVENVMAGALPLRGRMIHGQSPHGKFHENSQDYDAHGRTIFAIDRATLNKALLDGLASFSNVRLFFGHKLTGCDFRKCKAWFEVGPAGDDDDGKAPKEVAGSRRQEIEVQFHLMLGADGAHSPTRYHMMKFTRTNFSQMYIDALWCEFRIEPRVGHEIESDMSPRSRFAMSPDHLHIWPGKEFMFIAIPSKDGSFTCTLFLPESQFRQLEQDPNLVPAFFEKHFPGVKGDLISADTLVQSFVTKAHLPLVSLKCNPYHFGASVAIVGDAAHAMVPFYGQGMNTGLESVRVLFGLLDKHLEPLEDNSPHGRADSDAARAQRVALALSEYSQVRIPDAHAINQLALDNYDEMRCDVVSPVYLVRKWIEETVSIHFPYLDWQTKYSMVSFSNLPFSHVIAKAEAQTRLLNFALVSTIGLAGLLVLKWKPFHATAGQAGQVLGRWPRFQR